MSLSFVAAAAVVRSHKLLRCLSIDGAVTAGGFVARRVAS